MSKQTFIPPSCLSHPKLSSTDKLVYGVLWTFSTQQGDKKAANNHSSSTLAVRLTMDSRSAERALKNLEKLGFIERTPRGFLVYPIPDEPDDNSVGVDSDTPEGNKGSSTPEKTSSALPFSIIKYPNGKAVVAAMKLGEIPGLSLQHLDEVGIRGEIPGVDVAFLRKMVQDAIQLSEGAYDTARVFSLEEMLHARKVLNPLEAV